jgi:hypothetical protein
MMYRERKGSKPNGTDGEYMGTTRIHHGYTTGTHTAYPHTAIQYYRDFKTEREFHPYRLKISPKKPLRKANTSGWAMIKPTTAPVMNLITARPSQSR